MTGLTLALLALLFIIPIPLSAQEADLILAHDAGVVRASWSPNEKRILTAAEDGLARVWSVEDGELLLSIHHQGEPLTHARWKSDGAAILSSDESGRVLYSSAADGEMLQSWRLEGRPLALDLNAAETQVFVFTAAGKGAVLSLVDGATRLNLARSGVIKGAGWSADESQVRAWSEDGRVVVWELESGEVAATYSLPHRGMMLGMAWNRDDTRALAWYTDGSVFVYETDGISVSRRAVSQARHRSFVQRAIWSSDESRYMSWAADDTVHIRSSAEGQSQQVLRHEDWVVGASWDRDESRVLSWSHIYLYLWEAGGPPQRFRHRNLVRGAVWNQDASRILSWSWDGTARVWTS